MAESTTPRLGVPRWTEDSDTPNRVEFDTGFANLEARVAGFLEGTAAARPAAGAAYARFLYFAHDTGARTMCVDTTGAGAYAWVDVTNWGAIAAALVPDANDVRNLGASTYRWRDLFLSGRAHLTAYREMTIETTTPAAGSTVALDVAAATLHRINTPAGAVTVAFDNLAEGDSFLLLFSMPQAVTWPAGIYWQGGAAPALEAGSHNVLSFWRQASATWGAHLGTFG